MNIILNNFFIDMYIDFFLNNCCSTLEIIKGEET